MEVGQRIHILSADRFVGAKCPRNPMNNLCANVHVANKGAIDNAVTSLVRNSMRLPKVKVAFLVGFNPTLAGPPKITLAQGDLHFQQLELRGAFDVGSTSLFGFR